MVKALAPALKIMPSRVIDAARATSVVFETSNVAMSPSPLGTVAGVQLPAVFQLPLVGLRFQVALPARLVLAIRRKSRADFILRSQQKAAAISRQYGLAVAAAGAQNSRK